MIARIGARVAHAWLRARWHAHDRRALGRVRSRRIGGIEVVVTPGVFDPQVFLTGELLVRAIRRVAPVGGRVLDLGTGSGLGAIAASEAGAAAVVASDIDPAAVACARDNVRRLGVERRVDVRLGDLFETVAGERFDVVAFNPPYLSAAGDAPALERALVGPPTLAGRFAERVADHLRPGGTVLLVLSSRGRQEPWLSAFRARGWSVAALAADRRAGETLTAWGSTPPDAGPQT